jgi:hypothetical protein
MVLHLIYYFGTDRKSNVAARANNMFWLVETLKIFLSETTHYYIIEMMTGWSSTKFVIFVPIGNSSWQPQGDLV